MAEITFGDWLQRERKRLRLTQAQLADQIGCSAIALRKIEAEERRPSAQILDRLAETLAIPHSDRAAFQRFARGDWQAAPASVLTGIAWHVERATPGSRLPAPLTSFVGREQDVAKVRAYLSDSAIRLITLIGPPGIGKTRLSLQAASEAWADFTDGVFFVSLAPITDLDLVAPRIVQSLGLVQTDQRSPLEYLKDGINSRQLLIVLDNFEQIVEAAPLLPELLVACPRLKLIVTSRESLRVPGEWLYPVPPLSTPDEREVKKLAADAVDQYSALRLFAERAQAVRPDFALTPENTPTVAAICRHLDGLPLAIELIAARIRSMSSQVLLSRLASDFLLHADGMRGVPSRQKTLYDTIAWSYALLSKPEQIFLRRLAVFVNGWTLDAAEAVCGDKELDAQTVLELLTRLVDKSLIQTSEQYGETRYHMLETIREYAHDRLLDSSEGESRRQQHVKYFIGLARQAELKLRGPEQKTWVERLMADIDNIRAALEWSLDSGQIVKGLELAGALDRFWWYYNTPESRRWLEVALEHPAGQARTPIRAKALYVAAYTGGSEGRYATARAHVEESIAIWRELGDKRGLAYALGELGLQRGMLGDLPAARSLLEESIALFRKTDDRWGLALSLRYLGNWPSEDGSYTIARVSLTESLALFREIGDRQATGLPLLGLGIIATQQGNYSAARRWLEEALTMRQEAGEIWGVAFVHQALGWAARLESDYRRAAAHLSECLAISLQLCNNRLMGEALYEMAMIASRQGQMQRAARLFGATAKFLKITGLEIEAYGQDEYKSSIGAVRAELDEAALNAAWEAGRKMTLGQVIAFAMLSDDEAS